MKSSYVLKDLIAESKDGEWGKGEDFDGAVEMLVVRATDFEDVQYGRPERVPVRFIQPQIAGRKTLRQNDIIIETAGGGKDRPTGRTQLLRRDFCARSSLPITCASFCRFIRIDESKAEPLFVYWLLQGMYAAGVMKQFHTQHTGVARFQYTTFATTQRFSLPPRGTQRKIASILSAYDDLIENNTRRIAILETMAQAIYREWFVEFRFPGHEKVKLVDSPLGKIPEGWRSKPLREIADLRLGKMLDAKKNKGNLMPYLANVNVRWGEFDLQNLRQMRFEVDELEAYGLRCGDIVMCEGGEPGRCAMWTERLPNMMIQKAIHRIRSREEVNSCYLYWNLRHKGQMGHLESLFTGATIKHLPREKLAIVAVEVPPKSVADLFSKMVEPMAGEVEILTKRNANLRKTRDILLPKLISGQLNVEDLDIDTGQEVIAELAEAGS